MTRSLLRNVRIVSLLQLGVKGNEPPNQPLTAIFEFTSEGSGRSLVFAVLVDASEGWHGVRMPEHIRIRLQQMAEHPDSEWKDSDLVELAA